MPGCVFCLYGKAVITLKICYGKWVIPLGIAIKPAEVQGSSP